MDMPINLGAVRPSIDARLLPDLVDAYVREARSRVKARTADNYDQQLARLLEWWEKAGPGLGYRLDMRSWAAFEEWLSRQCSRQSGKPLTYNTRRACLARCRQLLRWAYRQGFLDRDFAGDVPEATGAPALRDVPTLDQLGRLLEAAGQSRRPVRDQALIALFAGTGIRRAEAAGLDVGDVLFHADGSGVLTVRRGKGDKPRRVAFDGACGRYLAALLDELGRSDGPLITGWHNRRLSPERAAHAVKAAMGRAGIDERGRGPHDLRRLFATEWARRRRGLGDGLLLSQQLGHSSTATTLLYVRPTADDLSAGFSSPLSRLSEAGA